MDAKKINWNKIALITGGVIAGLIGITYVSKNLSKLLKKSEGKEGIKTAEKEIKSKELTYTDADYQSMADAVYIAMKGGGTDYNAIVRQLKKLKTKSDWYKLVSAFGIKKVDTWVYDFEGNLNQWLIDELGENEQKNISELLSKIGVTF